MNLNGDQKRILESLADVLIPPGDSMPSGTSLPSASRAGLAESCETVLDARPDLVSPLAKILASATRESPETYVAELRANQRRLFAVLTEVVAAAYFMNSEVLKQIGYDGQTARPLAAFDPASDMELLKPVLDRGVIYRAPKPVTR